MTRKPTAPLATVPRLWPGETAVCIASGPSLTAEDVDYCRGKARVIVVNTSYKLAPWADVLYACDTKWWTWHNGVPEFHGLKYTITAPPYGDVLRLKNTGTIGLELSPTGLRTGKNSGYQAINLAVHFGVSRILLLGYDMSLGPKGETHWHGDHKDRAKPPVLAFQPMFTGLVQPLAAAGIRIVNCSRRTALTCFLRQTIHEALYDAHGQSDTPGAGAPDSAERHEDQHSDGVAIAAGP